MINRITLLLFILMIGLLTTSCESTELKAKRALEKQEKLEAEEKKKKTNEYNSLQLSKLKDKWRNDEKWNKNENWIDVLGLQYFTSDLQKSFMNNKIAIDTVYLKDIYMTNDTSHDSNVDDKWKKYLVNAYHSKYIARLRSSRSSEGNYDDRYILQYELSMTEDIFLALSDIELKKEIRQYENVSPEMSKRLESWADFMTDSKLYVVFQYNNIKMPELVFPKDVYDMHDRYYIDKVPVTLRGNILDYYIPKD